MVVVSGEVLNRLPCFFLCDRREAKKGLCDGREIKNVYVMRDMKDVYVMGEKLRMFM